MKEASPCKLSKIQCSQALLCFYRSVLDVPFKPKFFMYYRNVLQNIAKCYWNLDCQQKSLLCYSRVVDLENKISEIKTERNIDMEKRFVGMKNDRIDLDRRENDGIFVT